jgi:hypothetical protein
VLPLLKDCHLKELGMTRVGHRLVFLKFVSTLLGPRLPRFRNARPSRLPLAPALRPRKSPMISKMSPIPNPQATPRMLIPRLLSPPSC